jgi:nucleoside 2-deoxyribosyltransferase
MNPTSLGTHDRNGVYLAGPMVFDPDPEWWFGIMKDICTKHGLVGVSPLDNQIGLEGMSPNNDLVREIVRSDIALMHRLEAGVFCLDGFRRGPEMDSGTAFEIGYMCALGKPIAGWTQDPRSYPSRVEAFFHDVFKESKLVPTEAGEQGGTSGTLRDPDGILVHSEGCFQNAMTQVGIELGGGQVFANLDWRVAFDAAVGNIARRIGVERNRLRNAQG